MRTLHGDGTRAAGRDEHDARGPRRARSGRRGVVVARRGDDHARDHDDGDGCGANRDPSHARTTCAYVILGCGRGGRWHDRAAEGGRECGDELGARGVAIGGVLRQRAQEERVERGVSRRWNGFVRVRVQQRDEIVAGERRPTGDALEHDTPEAVEIGTAVDRSRLRLLRRHVRRGSDRARRVLPRGFRGHRDAKVGEEDAVALEQDVARLHVAVEHAPRVRVVQRGADSGRDREGALARQPTASDLVGEGLTFDESHREVEAALLLAGFVHGNDQRVVERGRAPSFFEEAARCLGVACEHRIEHLQCDGAVEAQLRRPVERRPRAASRDAGDLEPAEPLADEPVVVHRGPYSSKSRRRSAERAAGSSPSSRYSAASRV